jgi:AcrR family transcriptional regulator
VRKQRFLVAEDAMTEQQIAEKCGIGVRTLQRWKPDKTFAERVNEITRAYADRVLRQGLARKERRIAVLSALHQKMLQVIAERAESPDLAGVPGGKTGIVTKTLKGVGSRENFQIVEEYEVDTGTIGEIRAVQEQIAEELGQRVKRSETVDLNQLFERMSRDELDRYAKDGTLPGWFPIQPQLGERHVS